jgi:hypothetical protein
MAGLGVRLFTDEMISPDVAEQLQRSGYDVLSCQAAHRLGYGAEEQLANNLSVERMQDDGQ